MTTTGVTTVTASVVLLWMRTDIPRDQAMDYWRGPHSQLVARPPGFRENRQHRFHADPVGLVPRDHCRRRVRRGHPWTPPRVPCRHRCGPARPTPLPGERDPCLAPPTRPRGRTISTQSTPTPVLFAEMSTIRQVWESVGGAFVTGAIAGVLLGFAWWAYLLAVLVAFIGGVPSGSQHRTLSGALARSFVGGATWAVGVIVGLAATTRTPTIPMPDPSIYFLPYGIVPACVVGAISWYVASRRRSGEATR